MCIAGCTPGASGRTAGRRRCGAGRSWSWMRLILSSASGWREAGGRLRRRELTRGLCAGAGAGRNGRACCCEDAEVWRRVGDAAAGVSGAGAVLHALDAAAELCACCIAETLEGKRDCGVAACQCGRDGDGRRRGSGRTRRRRLAGERRRFAAEQYVFCLGTIESSRFFLQPREGRLPWNESGLLGRHFQDHIDANAAELRVSDRTRFHAVVRQCVSAAVTNTTPR